MDIKAIKELAQKYSVEDLNRFAEELENTGKSTVSQKDDPGEMMSDFLQAAEVRGLLDQGMPLQDAVRELSKRVRGVLTK